MNKMNQHDIAIELEKIVEKKLGYNFSHSGTFFSADNIHMKYFYDVMHFILYIMGKDGSIEFLNKYYYDAKDKNMDQIDNYEEIFDEFRKLI